MKFGVIFWEDTDNLGDDIQTYAAIKLLPKVDYYIDRENMDEFRSNDGKKVAAIMNGWFLHKKYHFPPSAYIKPLCVSMHFSKYDYYDLKYSFLEGEGLKWVKSNSPIGCRDISTWRICKEKKIDSYLSGCITLTLPKQRYIERELPYICAVDLQDQDIEYLKKIGDRNQVAVTAVTHKIDKNLINRNIEERFKNVENILTLYQNALCVVTTRLHCALPCLAMGVPVLFLIDNETSIDEGNNRRFDIFLDLLHTCTIKDFRNRNFEYNIINPPSNLSSYVQYRERIINQVKLFVNNNTDREEDVIISNEDVIEAQKWKTEMMELALNNAKDKIEYLEYINSSLYRNLSYNNYLIRKLRLKKYRKNNSYSKKGK